jgi:hypothetical protein
MKTRYVARIVASSVNQYPSSTDVQRNDLIAYWFLKGYDPWHK